MIYIGLAGWGDHDSLYVGTPGKDKLAAYAGHFPTVEVDSSFYAILPDKNYGKWAAETPASFSFVVKAYQGMTGHLRGVHPFADDGDMFRAFRASIQPLIETDKLATVLFQYPPWFDCTRENVDKLRFAKDAMGDVSVALEFRHQSWFTQDMREKTLAFMEREGWIHAICDEPQSGVGSVPAVLHPTDRRMTIVRFHGRNTAGWNSEGRDRQSWREVRYLYQYSEAELLEWKQWLLQLQEQCEHVYVVFNNNSGGHAAGNAKAMMRLLGVEYGDLAPRQLDLFGEGLS